MDMTNKEYGQYVNSKSKPSPLWKNLLWAFVTGGLKVVEGLYDGIEQMMHQGQEKIAGVWVDAEKVAKHNLRIDFSLVPQCR